MAKIGLLRAEEARVFNSESGYHQFHDEDGEGYGSFQVFWLDYEIDHETNEETTAGWYWWSCSPGCLPDGDMNGPFGTSSQARHDADENDDLEFVVKITNEGGDYFLRKTTWAFSDDRADRFKTRAEAQTAWDAARKFTKPAQRKLVSIVPLH